MSPLLKALLTTLMILTLPVAFGAEKMLLNSNNASSSIASSIVRLPLDCLKSIIGSVVIPQPDDTTPNFYMGYLSLNDLATLVRCKYFRPLVQPILDHANAWRKSNVITRSLSSTIPPADYMMASLFLGSCITDDAFTLSVYIPTDRRIDPSGNTHTLITNSLFTADQKNILICLAADNIANNVNLLWENEINILKNLTNKHVAIAVLKYILSRPSLVLTILETSALSLVDLGEKESAISILNQGIKAGGNNGKHLINRAIVLKDLGENKSAVEIFKYVAADPNSLQSYLIDSARHLQTLGEISAARDVCIKAINTKSTEPNYSFNLTSIADILFDLGETNLASELCHQVLDHLETESVALTNCIEIFENLNETSAVIATWHRIKTFSDQYPWVFADSAVAFEELGEKEAALESCHQAINHPELNQYDLSKVADVLEKINSNDLAITTWKKVLNQVDASLYTLKDAASSLVRLGDTASAITAWKKVLDMEVSPIQVNDAAYSLERLGDTASAVVAWKKFTQYPVEQCCAYILDIVPSLVRLGEKNAAISFCHRFFCDETSSIECLDGAVFVAKLLERIDAQPFAIVMWKALLNSPQAGIWQIAHAFLSLYELEKKTWRLRHVIKF